jgi:hypothetical protein
MIYTLPSTQEERLRLRAEIERAAAAVLGRIGFTVQERHRQTWGAMELPHLRRCAALWCQTAERFASLPPRKVVQSPPASAELFRK